ncbi:UNVERIFIED_CONTAM: hypothetical protein H355_015230 [Colinus virginianus]|nr:hypothetical protein H355_015230 [Colinus virginianus]
MDWASLVPVGLLFILILLLILKTQHFWRKQVREKLPPGPQPLPIIGNLHIMDLKKLGPSMLQLSETYGPVFTIQMGMRKIVVLSGYETVKEALVNNADAFAGRPTVPIMEKAGQGKGVIFTSGENWKVMRRFTLSTLRDFGMGKKAVEDHVVEEYGHLADIIESQKGKPLEMSQMLNAAIANIIVSILFGKRFDYDDPTFKRLMSLMNENMRLFGSPSVSLYNLFPILGCFLKDSKSFLQNVKEIHDFVKVTFSKYLKVLDRNDQRSFIDAFLVRQQEEKGNPNTFFDDENLIVVVRNLFAAGMDTTTTTLLWGLLLMMKYPEIQKKVQEEIDQVIGSNPPRTEHRTKMPYTDAVVHEIQRFANILPLNLPHETTMDVTIKGYFIPKGTYVIPLLNSVLQDKTQWEKPDSFYPEHFLNSEGKFVKKDAFMPFSAGRRICAGETLAKMELFLFFTSLLQRFTFQPPPGVSSSDMDLSPTTRFVVAPVPYKLSKEYGPVFSVQMGQRKIVVISGYETVKEALVNQADAFAERPKIPIFEDLTRGNGKPFDASKIINAAVANIIVSILLGKRFDYKDSRFIRLQDLINESMRLAGKPSVTMYNIFPYLGFLLRANKTLLKNRDEFHAYLKATFLENLKTLDKNDQRSFIDAFLVKQQEEKSTTNGYFHNGNLLSLLSNLFTAGIETVSTTLNWSFLLMLKYPEIQRKVQEEIEQVIGSNPPRIEHRTQMPYTDAVIHEVQRFANILPLDLPHETAEDVTLKDYFIPKGTYIIPLLTSVLRDTTQWEKPDMFYPEHFLDSKGKFVKKDAFMPFSAGRRICAGETLAKMELFLFFTSLLQRFTFKPPPGVSSSDLDLSPAISFNVVPKPYKICAVARS